MISESNQLMLDNIINAEEEQKINDFEKNKPMSIHWELRTILYLGILLFTAGIGILIYKNIETIGHQAIIGLITLCTGGCFYYTYKHKLPYSHLQVKHGSPFFDYIVLLGCLLFGILIGYLQFQYSAFGLHYGIATLIPAAIFLISAYTFDHKGVLSLAISGIAAWAGLSTQPTQLLYQNDFSSLTIIYTSIALGLMLGLIGLVSEQKNIKAHFAFSYHNFALNLMAIASLSALFSFELKLVSFVFLIAIGFYYFKYAVKRQSFLFLVLSIIYSYIALTYVVFSTLAEIHLGEAIFMLGFLYVMLSCAGIVMFFLYYKRILKIK